MIHALWLVPAYVAGGVTVYWAIWLLRKHW